jgi:hypothetical protein
LWSEAPDELLILNGPFNGAVEHQISSHWKLDGFI